jgi:hypothetical protein
MRSSKIIESKYVPNINCTRPFYFFYYYFQAAKIRSEIINLAYCLVKIWAIIELQVGHAKLAPTVKLVPSFTFLSQAP